MGSGLSPQMRGPDKSDEISGYIQSTTILIASYRICHKPKRRPWHFVKLSNSYAGVSTGRAIYAFNLYSLAYWYYFQRRSTITEVFAVDSAIPIPLTVEYSLTICSLNHVKGINAPPPSFWLVQKFYPCSPVSQPTQTAAETKL